MSKPHLPVSRVNTIMKSSSDVEIVSKESSTIMAKAAEDFIKILAQEGYKIANNGKKLDYKHLAEVVHNEDRYDFLREIMPKKITVAEFKKIMAKKHASENGQNGATTSSSSEEESSSDDSEETSN